MEWTKPGWFLEEMEHDASQLISRQITGLEDAIIEANIALNMFDESRLQNLTRNSTTDELKVEREISQRIESELSASGALGDGSHKKHLNHKKLVDEKVRHEMWELGFLPRSYVNLLEFTFAKAFLHALDLFDKFLGELAKNPTCSTIITAAHSEFLAAMPDLRGVRNSIQHGEDRSKGEQFGKKIDLKEIDNTKISIRGIALVNLGLDGTKFGATMANGEYGAIDVSKETLVVLISALLDVYSAFMWGGGEQRYPK